MNVPRHKLEVLITVKTYPHPSRAYIELVCTAGITRTGDWVRLYPIDFRYRSATQQFKKYQWISLEVENRGDGNDKRKESRKPHLDTIELLGEPLSTESDWLERRQIIDALPHHTLLQYQEMHKEDGTSLGIVRPTEILDFLVEDSDRKWKPDWEATLAQRRMFGEQPKPLQKIPFKFSYRFKCADSDKPHNAMCEDWELGTLYLKELERLKTEEKAVDSVKKKFFDELCRPDKDTRFFMGTVFPYNTWVVLGLFYPPRIELKPLKPKQQQLF